MQFFNKTDNIKTTEEKFNYIKNHFTYWTLNSWNRLKSIANNVKLYNLGLTNEQLNKAYEMLSCENFYDNFNDLIDNSNLKVGPNGRMGGYLVLYNKQNNGSVLSTEDYYYYETYQDFYNDYIEKCYEEQIENMINYDFDMIKEFDMLCDDIRDELIFMIDNATIDEEEYTITKTRQVINY